MGDTILQLLTAWLGSAGFCILFHLRRKHLLPASLGGVFTWGVYLTAVHFGEGIFVPTLIASAFGAFYAELLARILKAPATVFFIPVVIPLIPGSTLYYTMSYAVQGEWALFREYGFRTGQYVLGIAIGISLIWAFCDMERKLADAWRK